MKESTLEARAGSSTVVRQAHCKTVQNGSRIRWGWLERRVGKPLAFLVGNVPGQIEKLVRVSGAPQSGSRGLVAGSDWTLLGSDQAPLAAVHFVRVDPEAGGEVSFDVEVEALSPRSTSPDQDPSTGISQRPRSGAFRRSR